MTKQIVFGSGCFWCTEAVFNRIPGVISVRPGYAGGHLNSPTYKEVCSGTTGHAEVVEVKFDEKKVKLSRIIDVFFESHDPTTPNRQGSDMGSQYRSIILYSGTLQKKEAVAAISRAQKNISGKIVTEVAKLEKFFPAEDYHKSYFEKNPLQPYCMLVIMPKLKKLEKKFKQN